MADEDDVKVDDKLPNVPASEKIFFRYGLGGKLWRWKDGVWELAESGTVPPAHPSAGKVQLEALYKEKALQ